MVLFYAIYGFKSIIFKERKKKKNFKMRFQADEETDLRVFLSRLKSGDSSLDHPSQHHNTG